MTDHRGLIEARIAEWCAALPDDGLYAPMAYLMGLPAKRVRPALVLMGCELFDGKPADALDEALGIELFHNFTLMHDDIMDAAPLRRGQPTVHAKWNMNTGILSGDAMLVKAYQLMGKHAGVLDLFSRYALMVCEGQQRDMEFEQRDDVSVAEYLEMIRLKTAVLLSCALQVGAAVAGASATDRERVGSFGEHLGLAFQLRDDLLDTFGDPVKTGKQQGGDLRAGKKTFLLIRGLERAAQERWGALREELLKPVEKRDVARMRDAIERLGVRAEAEAEVLKHDRAAMDALSAIAVPDERKQPLRALATKLLERAH
ncbi:MAG: polyprenyl synthetase family protein [Flavobacteriales bacterium]